MGEFPEMHVLALSSTSPTSQNVRVVVNLIKARAEIFKHTRASKWSGKLIT